MFSGFDLIGWKLLFDCGNPSSDFNIHDDYQLFEDLDFQKLKVEEAQFCIFYPHDSHAPLIETKELNKIVVKVKIDYA